MGRDMKKKKKNECAPSEDSISMGIHLIWSESSLCAQWVAKDPSFLHADREDWSDWAEFPGWSESSLGAHSFCWFCHVAAMNNLTSWDDTETHFVILCSLFRDFVIENFLRKF